MASDVNVDALIAKYVLGDTSQLEPEALIEALEPIGDHKHTQQPWVWRALSLAYLEAGNFDEFLRYSEKFCFSDQTKRQDYNIGKIYLLIDRVKLLFPNGEDISREVSELQAVSAPAYEIAKIEAIGVTDLTPKVRTFDDDETIELGKVEQPAAQTASLSAATHFIEQLSPQVSATVRIASDVEYLAMGQDSGALRDGKDFYRHLMRSNALITTREKLTKTTEPLRLGGTAVVMSDLFIKANYCHWMCDWFPRLLMAEEVVGQVDFVCIQMEAAPFITETVTQIFGLPENRVLMAQGPNWYTFDKLVTVDNNAIAKTHPTWGANPYVLDLLRRKVLGDGAETEPGRDRIYISRRDAGTRLIVNEAELAAMLAEFGIRTVVMGDLSVRQQAQMFSQCEFVIGIHGANLTNIMFMPPGGTLVELLHYAFGSSAYATLARGLELDYRYLSCPATPGSNEPITHRVDYKITKYGYSDIWVDVDQLRRSLGKLPVFQKQ